MLVKKACAYSCRVIFWKEFQNRCCLNVFTFVIATKLESPYSPPDSDGTPLGSPENQCYTVRDSTVQSSDMTKNGESPKSNEHGCSAALSKQSANSPDRSV